MNSKKLAGLVLILSLGLVCRGLAETEQQPSLVGPDVIEVLTVPELLTPKIQSAGKSKNPVYSLSQAAYVAIPAKKTKLPLNVFGNQPGAASSFVPSGYMGDSTSLQVKSVYMPTALSTSSDNACLRVEVKPKGKEGWAGLYWQTPANNWAKIKGAGYDLTQAKRLTFWIRGEKGGEKIAEIKVGGLVGPYPDSDALSVGPIKLKKAWQQYVIDLNGADLRHISGGFCFVTRRSDNPRGAVFYLDAIRFETDMATTTTVAVAHIPVPAPSVPVLAQAVTVIVPFPSAKAAFTSEGTQAMDDIAQNALKYADATLLIGGHTDNVGPRELNKTLSYQRAKAVADYLESKGVPRERMALEGYGDERPIASNKTPQGRLENRRVEVTLEPK